MTYLQWALLLLAAYQGLILFIPPIVFKVKKGDWLADTFLLFGNRYHNARNNPLFIVIREDIEHFNAVLDQEMFECEQKKWIHKMIYCSYTKQGQKKLELMGHEIEVQSAVLHYGVDEEVYRKKEAESMRAGYKVFSLDKVSEIESGMKFYKKYAIEYLDTMI